jgi:hypothetical protein
MGTYIFYTWQVIDLLLFHQTLLGPAKKKKTHMGNYIAFCCIWCDNLNLHFGSFNLPLSRESNDRNKEATHKTSV